MLYAHERFLMMLSPGRQSDILICIANRECRDAPLARLSLASVGRPLLFSPTAAM
jgi:hypothetical protein